MGKMGFLDCCKQPSAQFTIEVDVAISAKVNKSVDQVIRETNEQYRVFHSLTKGTQVRYSLTIEVVTDTGDLRIFRERLVVLDDSGVVDSSVPPLILVDDHVQSLALEGVQRTIPVKGGKRTRPLLSTDLYFSTVLLQVKNELSNWRFYQLEPRALRAETPIKKVTRLDMSGANMAAFYNTLRLEDPRLYKFLNSAIDALLPTIEGIDVYPDGRGTLQMEILEEGVPYSVRVTSEGTLRLLALLAITSPVSLADITVSRV